MYLTLSLGRGSGSVSVQGSWTWENPLTKRVWTWEDPLARKRVWYIVFQRSGLGRIPLLGRGSGI